LNKAHGEKIHVDIDYLFMWRATVVFRLCGEPVKRFLEHGFYGLTLHMWGRELNQELTGDALT
jgi:hypothetical protein